MLSSHLDGANSGYCRKTTLKTAYSMSKVRRRSNPDRRRWQCAADGTPPKKKKKKIIKEPNNQRCYFQFPLLNQHLRLSVVLVMLRERDRQTEKEREKKKTRTHGHPFAWPVLQVVSPSFRSRRHSRASRSWKLSSLLSLKLSDNDARNLISAR